MGINIAAGDVLAVALCDIAETDTWESAGGADCSRHILGHIADMMTIPTGDNLNGVAIMRVTRFWHQVGNKFAQIIIYPLVSSNRKLKAFAWQFVGWIDIDSVSCFADNKIFQSRLLNTIIAFAKLIDQRNDEHEREYTQPNHIFDFILTGSSATPIPGNANISLFE